MPIISVRIPQIGEGLQEARLVAVLKQPGDHVKRDEPIYQMETDKAVMDVESPYEGILVEWLGQADDVLEIGAEVARMDVASAVETQAAPAESAPIAETLMGEGPKGAANIPPPNEGLREGEGNCRRSTGVHSFGQRQVDACRHRCLSWRLCSCRKRQVFGATDGFEATAFGLANGSGLAVGGSGNDVGGRRLGWN